MSRLSWQTYSPASESRRLEISKRLTPPKNENFELIRVNYAIDRTRFMNCFFFGEHACDSCTIWNYFVLFPQTCLMDQNRSHRPIVHLSIVTRAVSQCSVIINHALLFVTHQFILGSPCYQQQIWNSGSSSSGGIFEFGKRDLRLQLSLAQLQLNVK